MTNLLRLFSIFSPKSELIIKKEVFGFYNITQKTEAKTFYYSFVHMSTNLKLSILQQKLLNRKLSINLKLSFRKGQGVIFYSFLTVLFFLNEEMNIYGVYNNISCLNSLG